MTRLILFAGILATVGVLAFVLPGCDSAGTGNLIDEHGYRLAGAAVANSVRDSSFVLVRLTRDGGALDTALVTFGNDTLHHFSVTAADTGLYSRFRTSYTAYAGSSRTLAITDGDFSQSYVVPVPDTFSVEVVVPATHISNGVQPVSIQWTAALGVTGYVMAAVPTNLANVGFSQYVTTQANYATFPTEAFYPTGGINPDTGLYYLYVFGYVGVPDSALASAHLPASWPSKLADNLSDRNFTGHFGTVMVAKRDSVWVQSLN